MLGKSTSLKVETGKMFHKFFEFASGALILPLCQVSYIIVEMQAITPHTSIAMNKGNYEIQSIRRGRETINQMFSWAK